MARKFVTSLSPCPSCGEHFQVISYNLHKQVFCSQKCVGVSYRLRTAVNCTCDVCGKTFRRKPSHIRKHKNHFCSSRCAGDWKAAQYKGSKNPNYRMRQTDHDGYLLCGSQKADKYNNTTQETKLHRAICAEILGLLKIPKGWHVHHRDCEPWNNTPENLVVLDASDHKWLHKHFGNAGLWAYCRGLVSKEDLCKWCREPERAERLLDLTVLHQLEWEAFKREESELPEGETPSIESTTTEVC